MTFIACLTTRVPNLTTKTSESHYFVLLRFERSVNIGRDCVGVAIVNVSMVQVEAWPPRVARHGQE